MKRRLLLAILLTTWTFACLPAFAQDLPVYTDALANGFLDYSYCPMVNQAATAQVHSGTNSISWQPQTYCGLSFARPATVGTATYSGLTFWLWCSNDCARPLFLSFQSGAPEIVSVSLTNAYPGGVLPAMQWTQITISMDAGSPWALAPNANAVFDRFNLQDQANSLPATNTMYIDDVQFIARAAGPPPGGPPALLPPPSPAVLATPLAFTPNSTVNAMSGSQFTWIDSTGNTRSAHMATGTGGANKGGILNQFAYQLANSSTRTVTRSPTGAGGFGYIVSHLEIAALAINNGEDDSPLGPPQNDNVNGATQTVFAGRHHALHTYTLNYPRWGRNAMMVATKYNMPVTVGWVFATGRNYPLWTVSFDMTQIPANAVSADTRAPYGDMNFDGTTGEGTPTGGIIDGVGWGDTFKFRSTGVPFTLNSAWTWNTPNTIPHNMLWGQTTDSEMGIVLTQPIAQQDAGGYFGLNRWNSNSAAGAGCPGAPTVMPCDFTWPYQSINYSFGGPNDATQSKRLAWGANFGYLGQTNYPDRPTGASRSGHPYHSYSTYIVLDAHSRTPTDIQVSQMETRQLSSVGASVGTVATNGPAGLGRIDTVSYQPSGFDPVFDAWTFVASGNNVSASFTTPAPYKLHNPLIIVRGYTHPTEPAQVKVGGITLTPDVDYYASAITGRSELWLTLRGQFQGSTSVEVKALVPAVNYTVTASAGASGSIAPSGAQSVASGSTATFTVTPAAGYGASVGGSCGGNLNAFTGQYTTLAIVADCTVVASFTLSPPVLLAEQSRKTHGAAGTFDLRVDGAFTVEPRAPGAGHTIVFQFDQPITAPGTAITTNGVVTSSINSNQEVRVMLTGVADNTRATVTLSGVNGNGTGAVSLGFLVGDVNNSRSVNASDISGVKARFAPTTPANFQFDVEVNGRISAADVSVVKARSGLVLP